MKDNFLLKKSYSQIFNELTNEEAGKLIKGIFNYVCDNDSGLSGLMSAVFIPIKDYIDKNEEKYLLMCKRNKENGKAGGRPKKNEKEEKPKETQKNPVGYFGKITHISCIIYHLSYIIYHNSYINNHVIKLNIINNNKKNNSKVIKEIINYLNIKTKKNFK